MCRDCNFSSLEQKLLSWTLFVLSVFLFETSRFVLENDKWHPCCEELKLLPCSLLCEGFVKAAGSTLPLISGVFRCDAPNLKSTFFNFNVPVTMTKKVYSKCLLYCFSHQENKSYMHWQQSAEAMLSFRITKKWRNKKRHTGTDWWERMAAAESLGVLFADTDGSETLSLGNQRINSRECWHVDHLSASHKESSAH